jgi:hypothetical protein
MGVFFACSMGVEIKEVSSVFFVESFFKKQARDAHNLRKQPLNFRELLYNARCARGE